MLLQEFKRKGAKAQSRREIIFKIFAPLRLCAFAFLLFCISCSSKPTDLRSFVPSDTLVYLETNDLRKTLDAMTSSKAFQDAAKSKTDFSALANMQVAVAVTGFETSENQVTTENSVLNFKPRFVAIADTHAWNWQTTSFTENKLGEFVNEVYGGEVSLEMIDKKSGKSFVWTATDGRKVFAYVENSLIFFGNDETSIEKCLSVKRGEADSFAKNGKSFEKAENNLAFGYVSGDGVSQIANIVGVSTAIDATEGDEERSFIAKVLPEILRKSAKEIIWTATKNEQGIEDNFEIALTTEVVNVVKETLVGSAQKQTNSTAFLPNEVFSVTKYNLQNPQIAWRSLLLVTAKQTDELSGKIIVAFADSLLEPYGISDAETFLSAVDSQILTAQFDSEGENSVVIADVKTAEILKKSIGETNFKKAPEKNSNADVWKSDDGEIIAAFVENKIILGDGESVLKCLQAKQNGQDFTKNPLFGKFNESKSVAVTLGKDSGEKIVEVLSEKKAENLKMTTNFLTETRINAQGIERKTVSPFGLIGTILEQFKE
jgi:hypothetical protein